MSRFEGSKISASSFMGQLNNLRAAVFNTGGHPYLMLDPLLVEPWLRRRSAQRGNIKEHVIPIRQAGIPFLACPYFVSLGNANDWLLDDSFHIAWEEAATWSGGKTVCGWFSSTLEAYELKQVLAGQMLQGQLGSRWLLRFHDPRVLCHLARITQQKFSVRGIERWFFLDERRNVCSVEGLAIASSAYHFGSQEEELLDAIGLINQAYSQWANWENPPEDAFSRLFAALRVGRQHGLELRNEADCISFMLHKCLIHPSIEEHPKVRAWLEDARAGVACYADQAATCEQDIWQEIQMGNWSIAKKDESSW